MFGAHKEVAYAWGIKEGVLDELMEDATTASVEPKLKPLLASVRKLAATPSEMTQADAYAVFAAGWDEHALHDAIEITARAAFMQRLVEGHGFIPISRETAIDHARKRVKPGYVNHQRPPRLRHAEEPMAGRAQALPGMPAAGETSAPRGACGQRLMCATKPC